MRHLATIPELVTNKFNEWDSKHGQVIGKDDTSNFSAFINIIFEGWFYDGISRKNTNFSGSSYDWSNKL